MDFHVDQKVECIDKIVKLAAESLDFCQRADAELKQWQTFGESPNDMFASGILNATALKGLDPAKFSNFVGSLDALLSGWFATHAVNARVLRK